jgi:hypothetical protein
MIHDPGVADLMSQELNFFRHWLVAHRHRLTTKYVQPVAGNEPKRCAHPL